MREIQAKDFDYYENQASYFAYTHEADNEDCGASDEYYELDPGVIKAVEKRGALDRIENIPERNTDQLAEFIVAEGLLTKEEAEPVICDLYVDYIVAYGYSDEDREHGL
ncbi:MAG: hypothetical protein K6G22_14280 [Lachnospiraceae bacterium]|nr:hypothetical protein [Lachnospiraceae bacterium]